MQIIQSHTHHLGSCGTFRKLDHSKLSPHVNTQIFQNLKNDLHIGSSENRVPQKSTGLSLFKFTCSDTPNVMFLRYHRSQTISPLQPHFILSAYHSIPIAFGLNHHFQTKIIKFAGEIHIVAEAAIHDASIIFNPHCSWNQSNHHFSRGELLTSSPPAAPPGAVGCSPRWSHAIAAIQRPGESWFHSHGGSPVGFPVPPWIGNPHKKKGNNHGYKVETSQVIVF